MLPRNPSLPAGTSLSEKLWAAMERDAHFRTTHDVVVVGQSPYMLTAAFIVRGFWSLIDNNKLDADDSTTIKALYHEWTNTSSWESPGGVAVRTRYRGRGALQLMASSDHKSSFEALLSLFGKCHLADPFSTSEVCARTRTPHHTPHSTKTPSSFHPSIRMSSGQPCIPLPVTIFWPLHRSGSSSRAQWTPSRGTDVGGSAATFFNLLSNLHKKKADIITSLGTLPPAAAQLFKSGGLAKLPHTKGYYLALVFTFLPGAKTKLDTVISQLLLLAKITRQTQQQRQSGMLAPGWASREGPLLGRSGALSSSLPSSTGTSGRLPSHHAGHAQVAPAAAPHSSSAADGNGQKRSCLGRGDAESASAQPDAQPSGVAGAGGAGGARSDAQFNEAETAFYQSLARSPRNNSMLPPPLPPRPSVRQPFVQQPSQPSQPQPQAPLAPQG